MSVFTWFRNKIQALIERLAPKIRLAAQKAELVALVIQENGDDFAALEPSDIPYLYGPVVEAVIDAQEFGLFWNLAGREKLLAVRAVILAARRSIIGADDYFDDKWGRVYSPFIDRFVAKAKKLQMFGFKE